MKWWEKTVEYFFIRNYVGQHMQIAPLDGKEERAGDAIFSKSNNWVLIEFKKDKSSLASEEEKFNNYSEAKGNFKNRDQHHFLIYGEEIHKNGEAKFGLTCLTYFTEIKINNVESILESGIGLDEFIQYIEEFTSYKKVSDGSDGSIGSDAFGLVAGINANNEIVECISLAEIAKELNIDLALKHAPSFSPSMGR